MMWRRGTAPPFPTPALPLLLSLWSQVCEALTLPSPQAVHAGKEDVCIL